ncbi:MAG: D-alanyl-D-alanine carboxypeptidase, partial [Microbacterium sp.]
MEGPPPTRRSLREGTAGIPEFTPPAADDHSAVPLLIAAAALAVDTEPGHTAEPDHDDMPAEPAVAPSVPVVIPPTALAWVDGAAVAARATPMLQLEAASFTPATVDLLARAPRRTIRRPGVLVPAGLILFLVVAYCATTLLWPLTAVAPTVTALAAQPTAAAAASP